MKRRTWAALLLFCCWQGIGWAGSIGFLAYQDNTWALYRWDQQNPPQKIISNPLLRDWAVSPDQKIAVFSTTDGRMWQYNLETQAQTPINPEGEDWQNPTFLSPTRLVAAKNYFSATQDDSDLVLIALDSNAPAKILEQTGSEETPAAFNNLILYAASYKLAFGTIISAIAALDLSTGTTTFLTALEGEALRPLFAPDGKRAVWLRADAAGWRLIGYDFASRKSQPFPLAWPSINSFSIIHAQYLLLIDDKDGSTLVTLNATGFELKRAYPLGKGVALREIGLWN